MTLSRLEIKNLTVFSGIDLWFAKGLNIIVAENGLGKTHLLKIAYSALAVSAQTNKSIWSAQDMQGELARKLISVFKPDKLGRLVRRPNSREGCKVRVGFDNNHCDIEFEFTVNNAVNVSIGQVPKEGISLVPIYLPTKELLSIFPNFISVYDGYFLEFEGVWRDLCGLLGRPLQKQTNVTEQVIRELLEPLEKAMGGSIELDKNGHFYLKNSKGNTEMHMLAEGAKKLGMLARLIANGTLGEGGYLFWDEPEANLNPRLIKLIAQVVLSLSKKGVQVFIATHSLFFLREIEILLKKKEFKSIRTMFFGLHADENDEESGVRVEQGQSICDVGDITSLSEELEQSERFLSGSA